MNKEVSKYADSLSEEQIHRTIYSLCQWKLKPNVLVHHSPNEGKRGFREQANVKSFGVLKGFPDLLFLHEGRAYFIEVKRRKGKLSADQLLVREALMQQGFEYEICRDVVEAGKVLEGWGLFK